MVRAQEQYRRAFSRSLACAIALGATLSLGCEKDEKEVASEAQNAASAKEGAEQSDRSKALGATVQTAASASATKPKSAVFNIPVGPRFFVEPGVGIGPIRFGATVATIERLMEAECTDKTETSCRYSIQAVDFHLKDGVVEKIQLQGDERVFDPKDLDHTYGIFNGALPGGVQLGMYEHYVKEVLGEPLSEEEVKSNGPFNTVKRAKYWGMTLEYDKLKNGNVVLASVILTKDDPAKKPKTSVKKKPVQKPVH